MDARHSALMRKISAAPSTYIYSAGRRSRLGLAALRDLSTAWTDVPGMMELGIIDMFLGHLRVENSPTLTTVPRKWQLDADFAHLSIAALNGMGHLIDDPRYESQSDAVLNAWPGIFKWCLYIYDTRVGSDSAQERSIFFDPIVNLFYMLSQFTALDRRMAGTPGCIELAAKLWVLEDTPADVKSVATMLISTSTLGSLVKCSATLGDTDTYDRVITATERDNYFIAQLLLGRIKKAKKPFNPDHGALGLSWHINLLSALSQSPTLRRGFFDAGVIPVVTRAFVALSRKVVQNPTKSSISMMVSSFHFFHYLEGDDYPTLVHAIKAGFLAAFLDCSPTFCLMPTQYVEKALYIMREVLPPYLVHRSFIEAVQTAMAGLRTPHYQKLMAQPMIAGVWRPFIALLEKRGPPLEQMYMLESEGMVLAGCSYIECGRRDVIKTFKKCAACRIAHYCSIECQKLAWKSDHRSLCKQLKEQYPSRRPLNDRTFVYGLARWEVGANSAFFHDLAGKEFPGVPHADLMLYLDFSKVPEHYSVKVIEPRAWAYPGVVHSPEAAAALEAHFQEQVAQPRESGTPIIQFVIRRGATIETLYTEMQTNDFWEDKDTYGGVGSSEEAPDLGTDVEESGRGQCESE
ncbi:hypothetical protein B0H19DRAFT_1167039 [Mycena capillaripes]|nr:hypothetical protein B0H19DRAFT_1167039 [Mycena capillaripes]